MKKTKHIPRKPSDANLARCLLIAVNKEELLNYEMCKNTVINKQRFVRIIELLIEEGYVAPNDKNIPCEDTKNLIIKDYVKVEQLIQKNYRKCIDAIKIIISSLLPAITSITK